jgi:hypothetical protein
MQVYIKNNIPTQHWYKPHTKKKELGTYSITKSTDIV